MFEAHVLYLLRKYLGEYVEGLSVDALRISVWKGDVVLKDLNLKAEALNSLRLPVIVKAGFVGSITLKVPWKGLGKEPVIVIIDRVFVLAHPAPDRQTLSDEDREKLFQAKLQQIEEAELTTLEATRRSRAGSATGGNSWLGSLISTIIGNLKVSISNVHIRYEDTISNPGHPFCTGFTLSKLAAVTMDEEGNETFDTSGALDKLRKSLHLERLALYHDSDSTPWKLNQKWEDLTPKEWTEIFQEGINEHSPNGATTQTFSRRYLLSPINGVLKYHRLGKQERHDPDIPFEKASLVLSDVSVSVSESQYYDGIKLLETFSRYKTRVDISHLRPVVSISQDPLAWWRFAMLAVLQQRKLCYWFSWDKIRHHCQLRRRYVQLYVNILQQSSNVDILEVRQIERILDSKVILLWRLLAHAKFGYAKSKEASEQRENLKKSWWSFRWRASGVSSEASKENETQLVEEEKLTKEEWLAINEMLSYQPDEDSNAHLGKDLHNMMQYLIEVSVGKASTRIVNIYETEIICSRFEQLHVTTMLYPKSIHCNVTLKSCGLSSPEGSLAESVVSEWKANALDASFIHAPVGEDLAWRLTATIAPCHVTILMESYEQLLDFVKRSNAVSPTVAMETATALQMKLEQVTRRAQEQIQMVLEERNRFALDIDIDAPKVRVPLKPSESIVNGSIFLLDFGHFTLHTKDVLHDERQSLYSRFYISGRDMSASFVDKFSGDNDANIMNDLSKIRLPPTSDYTDQFYSILDRCGMSVVVDQIKVPHPRYPSTRVSVQVPNLLVHFSPERYFRIMELLGILHGSSKIIEQNLGSHLQSGDKPWHPVDLATNARTLVWRGLGNSLAEWHPCYLVLSGLYLYVLEAEASEDYQRCLGMAGRQVLEVPPASVDGSANAISINYRGVDIQKDNKGVEDIGDVIREGGGALAKGLFRGVTGILTKPLEGAKSSGVEGFVQGVGKGLIGAATQPVSGVLDLLSKTTEGANAVRMRIASAIMSEEQLLRKRLPRAIGGDNLLRPYDEYKAQGQAILQLAECGTFFGQVDLFKVRGKFALSDAYEDHFLLPKGKILLVTHRRVLLLQQPTNIMAQRKFSPARDPCSVLWDVLLDDLVTMELTHGKKDHQGSFPSHLILYLQTRSVDSNAIRMIKCYRGSEQATDVYSSIQKSLNAYGPHASKEGQRRKVPQPYSPHKASFTSGVFSEENFQSLGFHDNQVSVPVQSDCGSSIMQVQSEQEHQK
ncbi:vacuolar protein sorting-associated protein 13C-like [Zingiber officinale]|uniref:vacuolar protein sorting-associated protein 13C-like n=1 Tax=Zingiber officinale TaxID=94328 RepID=UPI001C4BD4DB|nr:vacuolar protein sorting-associated protein 13C-like [Zingiber officinale]